MKTEILQTIQVVQMSFWFLETTCRGTQRICFSNYLFFRQIFAGWDIWKKYVVGRKVMLGNRNMMSRIAAMCPL